MTSPLDPNWSPTPEELGAYADGELPRDLKLRIEDWLKRHPEGSAEVAELRELRALYDADIPPEPSAGTWDALFDRVLAGLPSPAEQARIRQRAWRRVTVAMVAAAVVLVAVGIWRRAEPVAEDAFPVATAAEIDIISIAGTDGTALVVGEPPVRGTLELLAPGEVTVTRIERHARDNVLPELRQSPPMIWARLDTELDD